MTRMITFTITDHPTGGRVCKTSTGGYTPDDDYMADLVAALAHLCLASSGDTATQTLTAIYARSLELLQPENHATVRRGA